MLKELRDFSVFLHQRTTPWSWLDAEWMEKRSPQPGTGRALLIAAGFRWITDLIHFLLRNCVIFTNIWQERWFGEKAEKMRLGCLDRMRPVWWLSGIPFTRKSEFFRDNAKSRWPNFNQTDAIFLRMAKIERRSSLNIGNTLTKANKRGCLVIDFCDRDRGGASMHTMRGGL